MFKIGEFSRISRVPVSALRYYAEIGLLRPALVDQFTSYRYYTLEQLPRLYRILALRDLGLALEQIAQLLEGDLPPEQLRGMLRLRKAELQQHLADEQARLARVEARLQQLEQEDTMAAYDVVIKEIPAQLAAGVRRTVANYGAIGPLYDELYGYLRRHNAADGLCVAIYHDEGYKESDVDAEAVAYLSAPVPATEQVKVYELPGGPVASVIHHGPYERLNEAYTALMQWIPVHGYQIIAAPRELYLQMGQTPEGNVTEVQFPVGKA